MSFRETSGAGQQNLFDQVYGSLPPNRQRIFESYCANPEINNSRCLQEDTCYECIVKFLNRRFKIEYGKSNPRVPVVIK